MSDIRCPHCDAALSFEDLANEWCENCGNKIPAFIRSEASRGISSKAPEAPADRPVPNDRKEADSRRAGRSSHGKKTGKVLVPIALAAEVAGGILYLIFRPDATIYVDNGLAAFFALPMDSRLRQTMTNQ